MINFLSMYDQMLTSYVSMHIELLLDFSDKISNVVNNWKTIMKNKKEKDILNQYKINKRFRTIIRVVYKRKLSYVLKYKTLIEYKIQLGL